MKVPLQITMQFARSRHAEKALEREAEESLGIEIDRGHSFEHWTKKWGRSD